MNEPEDVGVPVIAPVDAFNDRPAGKLPADTLYVIVPVPPVAVTLWLYGEPIVAAGRLAGVTAIAALTVTVYAREPVAPTVSVAVIVKLNVPAALAVPVIAPLELFSDKPVGKLPADTLNVIAPVPPVVVTVWLYARPAVVVGNDAGLTAIVELTAIEYACAAVAPTLSVAVIVKLNVPAALDVPVIAPLDAFNESPVGNAPAVTA